MIEDYVVMFAAMFMGGVAFLGACIDHNTKLKILWMSQMCLVLISILIIHII